MEQCLVKLVTACSHMQPSNKGQACECVFTLLLAKLFKDEPNIRLRGIFLHPFNLDLKFHLL